MEWSTGQQLKMIPLCDQQPFLLQLGKLHRHGGTFHAEKICQLLTVKGNVKGEGRLPDGLGGQVGPVSYTHLMCIRDSLSAQLCRRSHAVCCGGGTDSGNVAGAALQRWHGIFRGGLQRDDGAGRSTGVTVGTLEGEIFFGISENRCV